MQPALFTTGLSLALFGGLSGCELAVGTTARNIGFEPGYLRIETRLLDDDLVNFLVEMTGARTKADVADYAKCAAAQYALIRAMDLHAMCAQMCKKAMVSGAEMRFIPCQHPCRRES